MDKETFLQEYILARASVVRDITIVIVEMDSLHAWNFIKNNTPQEDKDGICQEKKIS